MKNEDEIEKAIAHLTKSTEHWLAIKQVLLDDIRSNQEIIKAIDKRIKQNELKMTKLN
jgi:hypothetical protein